MWILLFSACKHPCESPNRLDGRWIARSSVDITAAQGDNVAAYDWNGVFITGYSEWVFTYIPGRKNFDLTIDGQSYEADFSQTEDACEEFTLNVAGVYTTESGGFHQFQWDGAIGYDGPHLDGTFTFEDDWMTPGHSDEGTLQVKDGKFDADPPSGAGDTGDSAG